MATLIVGHIPFDQSSWIRYEDIDDITVPLLKEFGKEYGNRWPSSARLYEDRIDKEHDITPHTLEAAESLRQITGTVYAIVWPEGQAVAIQLGIQVGLFLISYGLSKLFPDEKVTPRKVPQGSPNNLPGDRKNVDRVLQRIPDIYGRVKSTPDLIQYPYISYENNLQVELSYMCIGRGEFDIDEDNVREGLTRVSQIPGASVAIYPPGEIPGSGTPQLVIGQPITDPIYTVVPVKGIPGNVLLSPNNNTIWGDEEGNDQSNELTRRRSPLFTHVSTGVGTITYHRKFDNEIFDAISIGDKVGLDWHAAAGLSLDQTGAISQNPYGLTVPFPGGASEDIPDLSLLPETLDDICYEVTNITDLGLSGLGRLIEIELAIPVSKQAEWAKLLDYNPTTVGLNAPAGSIYNRASALYVLNYRQGPFFCNDPSMEEVHLNFIAERGLWIDDGRKQLLYGDKTGSSDRGIELIIELTPADEDGIATGSKETFSHRIMGSNTRRDFIGETVKLTPSFTGRFLVAVYRNTLSYVRTEVPTYRQPTGINREETNWQEAAITFLGGPVPLAAALTWEDGIKWTHAYSMSIPKRRTSSGSMTDIDDFGNVTTVHSRIAQLRNNGQVNVEKRLNILVDRMIGVWNGTEFDPTPSPTNRGLDAVVDILKDPFLGNCTDDQIDIDSIVTAFTEVDNAFANLAATRFSHTFDGESTAVEDIISAIGESCFVQIYRLGDVIKALADVSRQDSSLIFNHRNKLPNTENRMVTFSTEEEYDGVEVEYTDDTDDQIKIYRIPFGHDRPRNARKIKVAGTRLKTKAAMHAWRVANRIKYQTDTTQFDACNESVLAVIKDRVLVSDETGTDSQDGEVTRIDGLTIYTSQEVSLSAGGAFTLFLQDVDGTVQSIPVTSQATKHSLVLGDAPSGSLVVDPVAGIFPKYFLVRNQDTDPHAFHVIEKSFKSDGVWSITAANYTEAYYFNDAIRLYLPFKPASTYPPVLLFDDRSPNEYTWTLGDSPGADLDVDRGIVYVGNTLDDYVLYDMNVLSDRDYTVALWANPVGAAGVFCESNSPIGEFAFYYTSGGLLKVSHNFGEQISIAGVTSGTWKHYGVTYSGDSGMLNLYINGENVATAAADDYVSFDGLKLFHTFTGKADSFRYYNKEQPLEFMRELYQKERL